MKSHDFLKTDFKLPPDIFLSIVKTRWHNDITDVMLQETESFLTGKGFSKYYAGSSEFIPDALTLISEVPENPGRKYLVTEVPGAYEIPLIIQKQISAIENTQITWGFIAIGCVIKGETDHNIYINNAVVQGLMNIMLTEKIPVGFGIITAPNKALAEARTSKAKEATLAVLDLISQGYGKSPGYGESLLF